MFARYGGEEFVFLLRGSPLSAAIQLAERVRQEVDDHVFVYDDLELKVTISLGVTFWDGEAPLEAEGLVDLADRLLYEAKEGGRNRVCHDPLTEIQGA